MHIPGSSKCVKFVPYHPKNLPKNRSFTYMEDPGIYIYIQYIYIYIAYAYQPKNSQLKKKLRLRLVGLWRLCWGGPFDGTKIRPENYGDTVNIYIYIHIYIYTYMSNIPLFTGFEDVFSIEHGGFSSQLC